MATDMQKLIGTSEEDEEEDMDMDVKEEDDGDGEENGEKHAATPVMVEVGGMATSGSNNQFQYHDQQASRRCRPLEEKERTKLRERHRRAITARILAGLRRHGNYNLRVRADINDVIAALAREAGWVVLPDGTTFPSRSQGPRPMGGASAVVTPSSSHMVSQQTPAASLRGVTSGYQSSGEYNASSMKGVYMPNSSPYDLSSSTRSQTPPMVGDGGEHESHPLIGGSMNTVDDKQIVNLAPKLPERDFAGTSYVPVYVMLPVSSLFFTPTLLLLIGCLFICSSKPHISTVLHVRAHAHTHICY